MVKKKSKKKKNIKKTKENKPKKTHEEVENTQLIWFFVVIFVVFASFLIPYFYIQSLKTFDYAGVDWKVEEYNDLTVYHTRFPAIGGNTNYNLYLRGDPRENNVAAEGNFSSFYRKMQVSFSPEVDMCRGEIPRITVDLGVFLKSNLGAIEVKAATTDPERKNGKEYTDCYNTPERTVVILEKGEENSVIQSEENPYCYTITVADCEDSSAIEKFMIAVINSYFNR